MADPVIVSKTYQLISDDGLLADIVDGNLVLAGDVAPGTYEVTIRRTTVEDFQQIITVGDGQRDIFTAGNGVNITPFVVSANGSLFTTSHFDSKMTQARLEAISAAGYDHARFTVDPWPVCNAANEAQLASVMSVIRHGIDKLRGVGLKVILDCHVYNGSGQSGWTITEILADYPSGTRWIRFLEAIKAFASLAGEYPSSQVALEQWNETNMAIGSGWPARAKAIFDAIRTVNTKTTVLVSPAQYANIGALYELSAADFDANTAFAIHNYELQQVSHQGLDGTNVDLMSRVEYPPVRSWKPDQDATIGSDPTQLGYINTYYYTSAGKLGAGGDYQDHLISSLSNSQSVASWCAAQGVPASRIFVTETGIHGDYLRASTADRVGATRVSRAAYLQDIVSRHRNAGHSVTIYAYDSPGPWDITNSWAFDDWFMAAVNRTGSGSYDTDAAAFFARAPQALSNSRKQLLSAWIEMLKASGAWSLMDVLYVPALYQAALNNKATALLNIKSPDFTLLETAGGNWLDNKGYAGDGSAAFLETGFAPGVTAGSVASQNNCHIGFYQTDYGNNGNGVFGNTSLFLALKWTSGTAGAAYGSCAGNGGSPTSGCYVPFPNNADLMASRSASGFYNYYLHGGLLQSGNTDTTFSPGTKTATSVTLSSSTMTVGKAGSNFSTARCGILRAGAALTRAQARDVAIANRFLMQGLALTA